MRSASSARRFSRLFFAAALFVAASLTARAQTTSFSGTVYSPLGATAGDPLPNILVFVEDPNNPAPAVFDKGVSKPGQDCASQPSLTPISVLGSTPTKPDGTYSFNVAGQFQSDPVNIYIQAGKWRLKTSVPLASINIGGSNTFNFSMPAMAGAGTSPEGYATYADLPNIAVVTGTADAIECIFPQIGISASEITDPTGIGHINFFQGTGSGGNILSPSTPSESDLVSPSGTTPLSNYDLVIFGCQGPSGLTDPDVNNAANQNNLVSYANSGGRVFATHWEFSWVNYPSAWSGLSSFSSSSSTANSTQNGTLATTGNFYTGEPTLAAWLGVIGAFEGNPANLQVSLTHVFPNNVLAVYAPAQDWIDVTTANFGTTSNQFSFDTPVGASGTPTASLNFSNSTSTFLTGDPDDIVTVAVANTSTTPSTTGLTLTLNIPSALQILSVADSSGGAWNCVATSPTVYTCTLPAILAAGATDSVAISFKIPLTGVTLGYYSLTGVLSGGGLNQSSQCGRVLYNDYHVESSTKKGTTFDPAGCGVGNLLNVQKFLEYSLYNLSSFVAPANSDTIQIQASSTIDWTVPTPTYYGTLLSQIETASVNTPGPLTYKVTPTYTQDPIDAATYSFMANFVPTDTTDYLSASVTKTVHILADPTQASIDDLDNAPYYGQEIGYNNGVDAILNVIVQPGLPNLLTTPTIEGGAFAVTIDGTTVCSGVEGTPITGGSRPGTCPDAGFLGFIAGPHTLDLSYAGTNDFAPSNSGAYTVTVQSDPTTTTLTSNASGTSILGSNLTYTANVADAYATAAGTVTFYDASTAFAGGTTTAPGGSIVITSAPAVNGAASVSLATLLIGTHNIFACFVAPTDSLGYPNMAASCSASSPQVVTAIPVTPEGTASLLRSSANPSPFGNAVSFTANVQSTGAFVVVPSGGVTFYDAGTAIGNATLDANGTAVLTTSTLAIGTHPITVSYAGTSAMAASASSTLNEVIVAPGVTAGTGFLLRVSPTTVPIFVGSTAIATVTIIPLTDFNEPVALTCTGMVAQSSCTFAQSTIPAGGGTTQMILSAGSPHDCGVNDPYFASFGSRGGLTLFTLSALTLCFVRRRRKLQGIALAVLLLVLPSVLAGCGAGTCTDFAVKPGDYNFTLTATSTGSTHTVKTQAMVMHATLQ